MADQHVVVVGGGLAGLAATVKLAEVSLEPLPLPEKVSTLSVPGSSIDMPLPVKLATPETAASVAVPDRVPVPVVSAAVIVWVLSAPDVTVFPYWSSTVTIG